MPTLADIYSAADSFKRRLSDAASNPSGALSQMLGYANDQARGFNELSGQAANEFVQRGGGFANQGPAGQALNQAYAESLQPVGMTVWHGSPYKFTQFDPTKIGSGEGAQTYGHGLYVAENPSVAKSYAENVKDMDSIQALNKRLSQLNKVMDEDSVYPGAYRKFKSEKGQKASDEYDHIMEMRNQKVSDKGNLYKIDLPDEHIEKMLDWDKPFANQPKNVKEALKESGIYKQYKANQSDFTSPQATRGINMRGENIHAFIEHIAGSPEKAAQMLKDMGIPGIKYLDATSRDVRKGTRNMVIFPGNEHLLNIQDINGKPIK